MGFSNVFSRISDNDRKSLTSQTDELKEVLSKLGKDETIIIAREDEKLVFSPIKVEKFIQRDALALRIAASMLAKDENFLVSEAAGTVLGNLNNRIVKKNSQQIWRMAFFGTKMHEVTSVFEENNEKKIYFRGEKYRYESFAEDMLRGAGITKFPKGWLENKNIQRAIAEVAERVVFEFGNSEGTNAANFGDKLSLKDKANLKELFKRETRPQGNEVSTPRATRSGDEAIQGQVSTSPEASNKDKIPEASNKDKINEALDQLLNLKSTGGVQQVTQEQQDLIKEKAARIRVIVMESYDSESFLLRINEHIEELKEAKIPQEKIGALETALNEFDEHQKNLLGKVQNAVNNLKFPGATNYQEKQIERSAEIILIIIDQYDRGFSPIQIKSHIEDLENAQIPQEKIDALRNALHELDPEGGYKTSA